MASSTRIGRRVLRYDQVTSTNDLAREFAAQGEPEGLVVSADAQTAGRGRQGRKWMAPAGTSLQLSILLRPRFAARISARLTQLAGLAVAATLEQEFSLAPALKWPNDVLLNGKKCAGILTESGLHGDILEYAILGIGLNLNFSMRAYPALTPFATTVQDELGHPVARDAAERALLAALDHYYARLEDGAELFAEYRARLPMLGQRVRVTTADGTREGIALDVDSDGALVLAYDGTQMKLYAGDTSILKTPGKVSEEEG